MQNKFHLDISILLSPKCCELFFSSFLKKFISAPDHLNINHEFILLLLFLIFFLNTKFVRQAKEELIVKLSERKENSIKLMMMACHLLLCLQDI